MCTGLVLFVLSLVVVVVVCRKQIHVAARKIVTVDEDRKFASPEISMSVRISKDAEDLASRVVLFVVDRSTVVGPIDEAGAAERKKPSNADPCVIKLLGRWVGWILLFW